MTKTQDTARFLPKPCAHQLLVVSSPRPRWLQLNALNLVSKAQALADVPYMGPVFGVSKTSISGFVAVGPHCAQLKTCCRIGGWNHHSGHRAIIFCDNCTQDLLSCFWSLVSWQGKCMRHGFTLRCTCIRRKLVCNTKSGPKNGVNFRTRNLFPSLLRAGFGGRWLVWETGLATQLFFSSFCPIIWGSVFGQHGRSCNDSLRARAASPPKGLLAQSVLAQS